MDVLDMISLTPACSLIFYQEVFLDNDQSLALLLPKPGFRPTHYERFERWGDQLY